MADAAVFEIFVYKNGQINTFMSIYDCLFVQLIPCDKQKQTFVQQFSKCLHTENVRTLSFSLLCKFNFLRICVFRLVGTQYINNSTNTRRSHTSQWPSSNKCLSFLLLSIALFTTIAGDWNPPMMARLMVGCQLFKSRVKQISLLVLQTETP